MPQARPVILFLSYAHEDGAFCRELEKHLSLLQRQSIISTWHHQQILAGANWVQEINEQFEQASMILLLISADFLASDYCYSHEMAQALRRHAAGEIQVIPILLRFCDWSSAPFAHLQALPTNGRPVTSWPDKDEAWTHVVTGIRLALQHLSGSLEDPVSIFSDLKATSSLSHSHIQQSATLEQRNRVHFLAKLQNRYREIMGYSLQGAAQIALELHSRPDAVINSTRLRLRQNNMQEYSLPAETTLLHVFDRTSGELLVLGDPGAGKTTQLLTLAEALCQRADQDEHALLPVVVNLSTWATSRKPIAEWLVEEIAKSYDIPHGPITQWVQQEQVLPLLDGLDEVDMSVLPACIEAINIYKRQHLVPLVVCCRTTDYASQVSRLALQNAVIIQPLTEEMVDLYFKEAGTSLEGIRSVLHDNAPLRELVRTPLMLNVVTLAYQGTSAHIFPRQGTIQEQQHQIFQQYVQRMLARPSTHFSTASIIPWLSWLARQMRAHNQIVFYVEHLQPNWLPTGRMQRIYDALAVRFTGVLLGILVSLLVNLIFASSSYSDASFPTAIWYGLMGGFLGGLISGGEITTFQFSTILRRWKWKRLGLLSVGWAVFIGVSLGYVYTFIDEPYGPNPDGYIYGIGTGVCVFLLCHILVVDKKITTTDPRLSTQKHVWWERWLIAGLHVDHLRQGVIVGLLFGLSHALSGLLEGLSIGQNGGLSDILIYMVFHQGLSDWLSNALQFSIVGSLLSLLLDSKRDITLAEVITWSLPHLGQKLFSKNHLTMAFRLLLFVSLFSGLSQALGFTPPALGTPTGLLNALSFALISGLISGPSMSLIYWLLLGVWNNLSQEILEDRHRSTPNQGVKRSVRNGIILGLFAGVLCGCVAVSTGIIVWMLREGLRTWLLNFKLSDGLILGFSEGLYFELGNGAFYVLHIKPPGYYNVGIPLVPLVVVIAVILFALLAGGLAGLRHLLLRILLTCTDQFPWHAIRFLDEATHRILLYRDGGGYRFIHRLLLDYFANLEPCPPPLYPEKQNAMFSDEQGKLDKFSEE